VRQFAVEEVMTVEVVPMEMMAMEVMPMKMMTVEVMAMEMVPMKVVAMEMMPVVKVAARHLHRPLFLDELEILDGYGRTQGVRREIEKSRDRRDKSLVHFVFPLNRPRFV
jgi:hypothetical protein